MHALRGERGMSKEGAMTKSCPDCREPLAVTTVAGVAVDGCQGCGGLWLDMGELGSLLQLPPAALAGVQSQLGAREGRPAAAHPPMLPCPACHRAMQEHLPPLARSLHEPAGKIARSLPSARLA